MVFYKVVIKVPVCTVVILKILFGITDTPFLMIQELQSIILIYKTIQVTGVKKAASFCETASFSVCSVCYFLNTVVIAE